jgi:predicted nucleotidyltransferase
MTETISLPKKKIADLCRRYKVRQIQLFGSALRENFGPESDLDVLVEFEPNAQIGFIALSRMQRELSELFRRPVDLVPQDGLKPRIREAVLSSAEVIYAA